MAEKIIGFRLKLQGEKETLNALNIVRDSLAQSGKAIDAINKKSTELDKSTAKIRELTKAIEEFGKQGAAGAEKNSQSTKKYKEELERTVVTQAQLMKELRELGDKASPQYQKLITQVAQLKVDQNALTSDIKKQVKEFEGLKLAAGSYRDLDFQLGKLRMSYKELSDEERRSPIGRQMLKNIKDLDVELKQLDASMGQYQRNVGNYASAFNGIATITQRIAGVFGIATGVDEIVRNNTQISDSLGDVRRVTQLSQQSVEELYNSLRQLDTRTALNTLLEISTIGGKLGISEKNLSGFTAAADKLQVALGKELGSNVEETTTKLAKLITIFDNDKTVTGDKLLALGNGIAYLANKGTASGDFLADFSNRLAGLSGIAPITLGQTLGLGAGFEELGQSSEVASTAVNQLILKIGQDVPKYAKLAGVSANEFAKTINSNPVEALIKLSEGLSKNKTGFSEIAVAFADAEAKGARVTQTLGVLGTNAEFFRTKISQGTESLTRQNDILDAYNIKNQTAGAALDKFKKSIIDITASTEFQKFLFNIIEGLTKFIQIIAGLPKFVSENRTELIALAAAYLALDRNLASSILSQIKASQAYELLTDATKRQALATEILGNVQRALPLLLVIAAVYGAVKAFQSYTSELSSAQIASQKVADAQAIVNEEAAKEVVQLNKNINILKSDTSSREEKKKAIDALIAQNPEYLQGIDLEKASISQLTTIQDELTKSIVRTQAARLKQQATDEIATQIAKNQLRITQLKSGADVTISEAGTIDAIDLFRAGSNREAVIAKLQEKTASLGVTLNETSRQFDETFGLIQKTSDSRDKYEAERDDRSIKAIERRKTLSEKEIKDNEKRNKQVAKDLKKEEDERIRDEKAAAENIFRIRQQLIDKTFEGQKLAAVSERNEQIKTLKGSKEQIEVQKALIDELLQKKLTSINEGYEAERAAALKSIEAQREDFNLRQANNTVSNIEKSGKAQNRVFQIETIQTESKFTSKEDNIRKTVQDEKELTRQLTALETERQTAILEIRKRAFEFNKDLFARQLQAQLAFIDTQKQNDLSKIDETEAEKRAKLDEQFKNGLLTRQEYNAQLLEIEKQAQAERDQVEADSIESKAELASSTAIDTIQAAQDIAKAKLDIEKNLSAELEIQRQKELQRIIDERDAKLSLIQTLVSGTKDLLGQDENNRKKYGAALKALAIAEIAINLQRQISNIAVGISKDTSRLGVIGTAISTTVGALQVAAAVAQATFAAAKVLTSKFEYGGVEPGSKSDGIEGGSIPSESGVIQGRPHSLGGVKVIDKHGGFYEVEGGEYRLRNGSETYIINKGATRQNRSQLDTLSKISRPSVFSAHRKAIASAINSSNGGVKFANGGVLTEGGVPFNTPVMPAPLPPSSQNIVVMNNGNNAEILQSIQDTQDLIIASIEATNSRIDRISVINKPDEVYDEAIRLKNIKVAQNL